MRFLIVVFLLCPAIASAQNFISYTATWSAPTGGGPVDGYVLYLCNQPILDDLTCPDGNMGFKATEDTSIRGYYDSDVSAGTLYARVIAINSVGSSVPSSQASLEYDISAELPGMPHEFQFDPGGWAWQRSQ